MSKRRVTHSGETGRRRTRPRRRRRQSKGIHPLIWMGGALGIAIVLVVIGLWKPDGLGAASATTEPSRTEDEGDLLPLAEARLPLRGGHDVSLLPEQTPAPREAPAGARVPRLDLPSDRHDFGRIGKRPDVSHVFAVQNVGDTDLAIRNLVTSCGCTVAELTSSTIPPGQRADLTVTFDPDFHETNGEVTRVVWFGTNDPEQPWVEVRITANVQ